MNLLVSYNWIKEYLKCRDSAENFAKKISLSGPAVERSYPQAPLFENMVVGEIEKVEKHPNADKLSLVTVNVGKSKKKFVCGGINLSRGMKVAVALVGAKVFWHGEDELVELKPVEIRGVKSDGMVCGANEIGLAEAFPHADKEILDLSWCKAKAGTTLAKALGLEDTVFDIEVTTNRPDAFSVIGLAREASAILDCPFIWKEPVVPSMHKAIKPKDLSVKVEDGKLCTRYQAIVMEDICVGPSPWWLKNRLRLAGIRPINNVVDISNYVMLEYGQPMHAFDYDKLEGQKIIVRRAKENEKIVLLDGNNAKLKDSMLVIADAKRPIAVAGVMGGEKSSVSEKTKRIVFESATFDSVSVRHTARDLNTHTDSSLRFEKGLPEDQAGAAMARAVELCQEVSCGRVASPIYDKRSVPAHKVKFSFRPAKAEALIGVKILKSKMIKILKSLGFQVSAPHGKGANIRHDVVVPYWRERDIEGERDFAEEIARIYGYHNLPSVIPEGELPLESPDILIAAEENTRQMLRGAGYTEVLNYSFISRDLLEKTSFDADKTLRVANPLSNDFEFMRPCLIPGMLKIIAENQGMFPEGNLFEVSRVYKKQAGAKLPQELTRLLVMTYGSKDSEAQFRHIKGVLSAWCERLNIQMPRLVRGKDKTTSRWHPGRSAELRFGDKRHGWIGEIHPVIRDRFGIDSNIIAFEVNLTAILEKAPRTTLKYDPSSSFPSVLRDLAFVVKEDVDYEEIEKAISTSGKLMQKIELFDVYRGKGVEKNHKSLALHLEFGLEDRTLTAEEADKEIKDITKELVKRFNAKIRS